MFRALLMVTIAIAAAFTGTSAQAQWEPPCWTTFDPPAPEGAAMNHYYKNCNPETVWVDKGITDRNGQINFGAECRAVRPGDWVLWTYRGTDSTWNYHTMLCHWGDPVTGTTGAADAPCFSSFVPGAPNGGPMTFRYRNCNGLAMNVGPAYTDGGGQITVLQDHCKSVLPGAVWQWEFSSTVRGVNYSTALCGRAA